MGASGGAPLGLSETSCGLVLRRVSVGKSISYVTMTNAAVSCIRRAPQQKVEAAGEMPDLRAVRPGNDEVNRVADLASGPV